MEGVSHPEFRRLMCDRGELHLVCTEFVRITDQPVSAKQLQQQVQKVPGVALSVQVMGNDERQMADAAAIVCDAGADVVDINLGCPMPRVVRKGVGAAMLKDRVLLARVLENMRKATSGLLSAKIRAGFDDANAVVETAKLIEDSGVDFIAVHPRRRCDFYRGVADWRIIARLAEELCIPVVGNGDVWYAADALRMQQETKCAAVMIGRPSLRNPWLFRQIADLRAGKIPYAPDGAAVVEHLHDVYRRYSSAYRKDGRVIGPLKELLSYIGRAVDDGGAFRKSVLRLQTPLEILVHCERQLNPLTAGQLDLNAYGDLALEESGTTSGPGDRNWPLDAHASAPPPP
jgi:nifR3 family TIM-barrel protein